jgi:hypothetical protein
MEVKNWGGNGIITGAGVNNNEWLNMYSHDNARGGLGHGIYLCGSNDLIQGGIYANQDNPATQGHFGIQIYCSPNGVNNTTIDGVLVYGNPKGVVLGGPGDNGTGNILRNSIIRDNTVLGIQVAGTGTKVYNNTIVRNGDALSMWHGDSHDIEGNIIYGNAADSIVQGGDATWTDYNNLKGVNPLFVDYYGNDFRLTSSSPAIQAGVSGAMAPTGSTAAAPPQPPRNLRIVQ